MYVIYTSYSPYNTINSLNISTVAPYIDSIVKTSHTSIPFTPNDFLLAFKPAASQAPHCTGTRAGSACLYPIAANHTAGHENIPRFYCTISSTCIPALASTRWRQSALRTRLQMLAMLNGHAPACLRVYTDTHGTLRPEPMLCYSEPACACISSRAESSQRELLRGWLCLESSRRCW